MIKKLAKCVGEFKKDAIKTPLYVAGECVFDVIIPFFMAFLIDEGINKGSKYFILTAIIVEKEKDSETTEDVATEIEVEKDIDTSTKYILDSSIQAFKEENR